MNKKGFTLIEILVTISILALITIIAVPTINKVSKQTKEKLLTTKINEAEEATILWAQDNASCLLDENENCMISSNDCKDLVDKNNNVNTSVKVCSVTLGNLASYNLIKYDDDDTKIILSPVDNADMTETEVQFTYNVDTKMVNLYNVNFVYETTTTKSTTAKPYKDEKPGLTNLNITSEIEGVLDSNVNIAFDIIDIYGGTIKVCVSDNEDMSKCTFWKEVTIKANTKYSYSDKIDLTSLSSNYETGSGANVKLYIFIQNKAYMDAITYGIDSSNLLTTASKDFTLYKYCSETVTEEAEYSTCSKSCGGGTQSRTNTLKDKYYSDVSCGTKEESQDCNTQDCCSLTSVTYTNWGSCSASCGGGSQTRTATYKSSYDGSSCGTKTETQNCNTQSCCSKTTVTYSDWGSCSTACGGGTQSRTATYKSSYNSTSCGTKTETQSCNTQDCCSSTTASYGSWGSCSASCGGGTQSRTVTYKSTYNSATCETKTESQSCNTQSCCTNVRRWTCASPTTSLGYEMTWGNYCSASNPCLCQWNGYYYSLYSGYVSSMWYECV